MRVRDSRQEKCPVSVLTIVCLKWVTVEAGQAYPLRFYFNELII